MLSKSSGIQNVDRFFAITDRASSFRTELLAGLYTFLSLSYIFVINPVILGSAGFEMRRVLVATVIGSAVATICSGLWTRLPFVFAPGLEMSLFIAFVAIPLRGIPPPQVMGIVLVSGVATCFLGLQKPKHYLVDSIPHHFPNAVAITMAVFLFSIACELTGLVDYHRGFVVLAGHYNENLGLVGLGGLFGIILLEILGVKASVLIMIIITSVFAKTSRFLVEPDRLHLDFSSLPDIVGWLPHPEALRCVFALFVLACYGSFSKAIKMATGTTIESKHGALPNVKRLFVLEGLGTIAGSLLGTTNLTMFVESGAGIAAGGRTGLTALISGALMLSGLLLFPFIQFVPISAAVGALIYVAFLFVPKSEAMKGFKPAETLIVLAMSCIVFITLSLSLAFAFGMLCFLANRHWQNAASVSQSIGQKGT